MNVHLSEYENREMERLVRETLKSGLSELTRSFVDELILLGISPAEIADAVVATKGTQLVAAAVRVYAEDRLNDLTFSIKEVPS